MSRVMLVGQAPGGREPAIGKPFAWTAGKTLFQWLEAASGMGEEAIRERLYIAAVCRCFPGKHPKGGDRVPDREEIAACRPWMEAEVILLRPHLVIPVGKLAIAQFLPVEKLVDVVGDLYEDVAWRGHRFDVLPLPHPSGASTWHRMSPGKELTELALKVLGSHPAIRELAESRSGGS